MIAGRRVRLTTHEPAPYHCDGDLAGETPFSCELVPGALRLLVPDTAPRDLFHRPGQKL